MKKKKDSNKMPIWKLFVALLLAIACITIYYKVHDFYHATRFLLSISLFFNFALFSFFSWIEHRLRKLEKEKEEKEKVVGKQQPE
jgi:hypothetical protein